MAGTSGTVKSDRLAPQTANKGIGIPGVTDASAATAGDIGETVESVITSQFSTSTPSVGVYVDVTSGSISLTAGHWLLTSYGALNHSQTASASNVAVPHLSIRDGANTVIASSPGIVPSPGGTLQNDGSICPVTLIYPVNISATTTYKMSVKYQNQNGTATVASLALLVGANFAPHYFIRAIRIR